MGAMREDYVQIQNLFRIDNKHTTPYRRQEPTLSAKNSEFAGLSLKPTEAKFQPTTERVLAGKLQWHELQAQRSQTYYAGDYTATANNGLIHGSYNDRIPLPIQGLRTQPTSDNMVLSRVKGYAMTAMESHPRQRFNIGCSNPYMYQLPDGTIVDMATRRMYKKQPQNNFVFSPRQQQNICVFNPKQDQSNSIFSPSSMMALSSAPALKPQSAVKQTCPFVDLTAEQSFDDDDSFPKIVSTFSLNTENSPLTVSDIQAILNKKENNNNDIFIDDVIAGDDKKRASTEVRLGPNEDLPNHRETKGQSVNSSITLNGVMGDVTNLRSDFTTNAAFPFTNEASINKQSVVEVPREVNRQAPSNAATCERAGRRRKAVHEVRKDYSAKQDILTRIGKNRLEGVTGSSEGADDATGTPWTLRVIPDKTPDPSVARLAKIRTLKKLLSKQKKAVNELRVNGRDTSTKSVGKNKVNQRELGPRSVKHSQKSLMINICDFNPQFRRMISEGKRHFRVGLSGNGILTGDDVPIKSDIKRRPRKSSPRKLNPTYMYPSYVTCDNLPGLKESRNRFKPVERVSKYNSPRVSPSSSDNEDEDATYEPKAKRPRGRPVVKSKGNRRNTGRSSPLGEGFQNIAVVTKDAWHVEMEKVEKAIGLGDKSIDQNSYLLFLGLKRA